MKNVLKLIIGGLLCYSPVFSSPTNTPVGDFAQVRSNLYIVPATGAPVLMDGSLTQYYYEYSNDIDGMDARKMSNPSENWGMERDNNTYVIERRHSILGSDSIFYKMWNMRIIHYRIEFITSNLDFPGRQGFLKDNYLQTSTPVDLNGTTDVDFNVTSDPASKAADRFTLIFANSGAAGHQAFSFVFAKAVQVNNSVSVTWQTENDENLDVFAIERSSDGIHFQPASSVQAKKQAGMNSYQFVDQQPAGGDNYYRISGIGPGGKEILSDQMKVYITGGMNTISIYPNPATVNNLHLKMVNQLPGSYDLRLINSFGQVFMRKQIEYAGGSAVHDIKPAQNVPPGIYKLEIKMPDGNIKILNVVL